MHNLNIVLYHRYFVYQRLFFQKEGKQIANRVNDSNRPKSMAVEIIILVYADMSDQLQVAPNWPNTGPVLLIAAMERPNASEIEIYPSTVHCLCLLYLLFS